MSYNIRLARPADAGRLLEIYTPYVLLTAITFEYEPPTVEEFRQRIVNISAKYPWLVCEQDGLIIGYTYASDFRFRAAYQWSLEPAIYMAPESQGKGIGSVLYDTLLSVLKLQGICAVFGAIALPNERSEQLHVSKGFTDAGVFRQVGYKHGKWHDVQWYQLVLSSHPVNPKAPASMGTLVEMEEYDQIIADAISQLNQ